MAIGVRNKSTSKWYVQTTSSGTKSYIYIPDPNFKVEHTNVVSEDSGRNDSGFTEIGWIRRDVTKVYISYSYMTESELNYMFDLLQGKEFYFTFPDRGSQKKFHGYCGECSYEMYISDYLNSGEALYQNVSFNIIEK